MNAAKFIGSLEYECMENTDFEDILQRICYHLLILDSPSNLIYYDEDNKSITNTIYNGLDHQLLKTKQYQ